MRGGDIPRMMIAMPDDNGDSERSYGSNTMLMVRAKNPRIVYTKEST